MARHYQHYKLLTSLMPIARGPSGQAEAIWRRGRESKLPIVIPAPYQVRGKLQRESRVSTITLLWRLRSLMQTNLFNCPVMQTVVFTLIPWILDQVEDDKRGGEVG